jgi:O-ureido-D-serine cyclo-ligase
MPHIALVTTAPARDLDDDLVPLTRALEAAGARVSTPNWDDPAVDWSSFDLALLRSTWDYSYRIDQFRPWTERVAAATRLLNPPAVVRWNTDKHYLQALERAGVAIVPSAFLEPGDDAATLPDHAEFVVKPAIGAGSRDAQRYVRAERAAAIAHAQRLLDARRSVLVQPYLDRVDEHGETALMFFDGEFSHAIRKGPLLKRGEGPTRALFAEEHITPRAPTAAEMSVAKRTLDAIPFDQPLLYARVDLLGDAKGEPCVLELELAEPSLFFAQGPGSAERFAKAILERA